MSFGIEASYLNVYPGRNSLLAFFFLVSAQCLLIVQRDTFENNNKPNPKYKLALLYIILKNHKGLLAEEQSNARKAGGSVKNTQQLPFHDGAGANTKKVS